MPKKYQAALIALAVLVVAGAILAVSGSGEVFGWREFLAVFGIPGGLLLARYYLLGTAGRIPRPVDSKIVSLHRFSPSSGVCLLRVSDRVLVLGYGQNGVNLLDQLAADEVGEVVEKNSDGGEGS